MRRTESSPQTHQPLQKLVSSLATTKLLLPRTKLPSHPGWNKLSPVESSPMYFGFHSPYSPSLSLSPAQIRSQWERSLSLAPTSTSPTPKGEVLLSKPASKTCCFTLFCSFGDQMEAPAAGAAQAAIFHACGVQQQHAQPRGPHHTGHEHGPAVHEGARQPHARSVSSQTPGLAAALIPDRWRMMS